MSAQKSVTVLHQISESAMFSSLIAILIQGVVSAPTAAPPSAAPATAEDAKMVCRRFSETGSHVRKSKVCKTRADWRRLQEQAREDARGLQTQLSSERGG